LQQVLAGDAGVHPTLEVIDGRTDHWLHVLHRVKAGRDVFFVANQNHTGPARQLRLRTTAQGEPECWDPTRNEVRRVAGRRNGDQVELTLTMEPNESLLLVFQSEKRALAQRLEAGALTEREAIPVVRDASPAQPEPELESGNTMAKRLAGCSWVWYPEGDPASSAPPGTRYFRKQIGIPEGRKVTKASFSGTADNSFTLFINGKDAGHSDDSENGWRNPVELEVTSHLRPGLNQLALLAVNGTDHASPAGLIGQLTVEFDQGAPLTERVDKSWKTSKDKVASWTEASFDDGAWIAAREVVAFGAGPWGRLGGGSLTLSPVKADPFDGHCEITTTPKGPVYLEMGEIAPEAAARVTINGQYAGGVIGKPLRLDVTAHLKPGRNTVRIEPFAPKGTRLVSYE
jgi:hypothetical protein